MNKQIYNIFTVISFALLIASPGRFAFGLIICAELFFLAICGLIVSALLEKLNLNQFKSILTIITLIFSTILYKQIIMWLFPLIALQLSFVFYLPAISSYMIGMIYKNDSKIKFSENIKIISFFSIFALVFYLIRDILGFGSFTFPTLNGIFEIILFNSKTLSWSVFFASMPGALFLVTVSILVFVCIQNKFNIIERIGDENDS
jgi:hypothetical protein